MKGTDFGSAFKVSHKMQLQPNEASYQLTLDSQQPVQMLVLQADIPVEIFSQSSHKLQKEKPQGCHLLSTFKFDNPDQRRITVKLRTSEGRNGTLSCLLIPHESKTAVALDIPLKALNLHTRCEVSDAMLETLPVS